MEDTSHGSSFCFSEKLLCFFSIANISLWHYHIDPILPKIIDFRFLVASSYPWPRCQNEALCSSIDQPLG